MEILIHCRALLSIGDAPFAPTRTGPEICHARNGNPSGVSTVSSIDAWG